MSKPPRLKPSRPRSSSTAAKARKRGKAPLSSAFVLALRVGPAGLLEVYTGRKWARPDAPVPASVNKWNAPGGGYKAEDTSIAHTAVREFTAETGWPVLLIPGSQVTYKQIVIRKSRRRKSLKTFFLGLPVGDTTILPPGQPDDELQDLGFQPVAHLLALPPEEVAPLFARALRKLIGTSLSTAVS